MSKKKAKLKLVFKTQPFLIQGMDHDEFEDLVKHHYKVNYDFKVSIGRCQVGSRHLYFIDKSVIDSHGRMIIDRFKIGKGEQPDPELILTDLCNLELIEDGAYLINYFCNEE